ncbi:glycosyltransferase [Microgenomates group bacterium]|nr:glycosyltransferase [Microgenomates group bacterium]
MSNSQTEYYEKYWRHRLKTEPDLNKPGLRINLVVNYLPKEPGTSLLDIGCGEGSLGKKARQVNPGLKISGIDISTTALKLAQADYNQTYHLDVTKSEEQKKVKGRFASIVALEIIEHLVEPEKLLQFAYEHLKDDGRLIISFPNTAWWQYRWDLLFKGRFIDEKPTYKEQDHLHWFTLDSITRQLNHTGFWIEAVDGVFSLPWYLGRLQQQWQRLIGRLSPGLWGYQIVLVCRKISRRPIVTHLMEDFLNPGENWLYTQIITSKKTQPLVLTRNLKNANRLPYFGAVYQYPLWFEVIKKPNNFAGFILRKVLALAQRLRDRLTDSEYKFYRQILLKSRARLIHAHYGTTGYRTLKLKQASGLPLVVSFYGSDAYWLPVNYQQWKNKYRLLFELAEAFIVKGPKMKQQLIKLGCPANKIHVIDHGVRLEQIPFKIRKPSQKVKLLTACSLIDYKGIDVAIKAFQLIAGRFPQASLTIIGSGPEEEKIDQLINRFNLNKRVRRRPFMPLNKLLKEVEKYHIFLHPSFTSADNKQEGIPTSIIERSASGMPIIATRHSDIPEIIHDAKNGYLVEEQNEAELAEKLNHLIRHQELWQKFGRYGRQLVEKNFNAVKQTAKREALYQRLIGKT